MILCCWKFRWWNISMCNYCLSVTAWWTAVLPQTVLRCAVWTQRYEARNTFDAAQGTGQQGAPVLRERLSLSHDQSAKGNNSRQKPVHLQELLQTSGWDWPKNVYCSNMYISSAIYLKYFMCSFQCFQSFMSQYFTLRHTTYIRTCVNVYLWSLMTEVERETIWKPLHIVKTISHWPFKVKGRVLLSQV